MSDVRIAQPWPKPGEVIPDAVEDPIIYAPGTSNVEWVATKNAAFTYWTGQMPGDIMDDSAHDMAAALHAQVKLGEITAETALQSASEAGLIDFVIA